MFDWFLQYVLLGYEKTLKSKKMEGSHASQILTNDHQISVLFSYLITTVPFNKICVLFIFLITTFFLNSSTYAIQLECTVDSLFFNHNWHEEGYFYPLVLIGSDFVS